MLVHPPSNPGPASRPRGRPTALQGHRLPGQHRLLLGLADLHRRAPSDGVTTVGARPEATLSMKCVNSPTYPSSPPPSPPRPFAVLEDLERLGPRLRSKSAVATLEVHGVRHVEAEPLAHQPGALGRHRAPHSTSYWVSTWSIAPLNRLNPREYTRFGRPKRNCTKSVS
jgi:hypothetical protein